MVRARSVRIIRVLRSPGIVRPIRTVERRRSVRATHAWHCPAVPVKKPPTMPVWQNPGVVRPIRTVVRARSVRTIRVLRSLGIVRPIRTAVRRKSAAATAVSR